MAEFQFIPAKIGNRNCDDKGTFGNLSTRYDYVVKALISDDDYPPEACLPWLHYNMRVGNLRADQEVVSNGGAHRLSNKKNFDIPHPNKSGWRLRHTCLEGPENAVYFRGRLKDNNVIELPEYWKNFIDPESITVSLTQIGSSQDLIVDKIEWGSRVLIRSGNASAIDCYYLIHGERIDGEKLIVEYEGQTPADYPGDNSEYSVAGYHYDTKEVNKK
jgi:hypothetical protein